METNGDLILKVLNKELTLSEAFRQAQENVFEFVKQTDVELFNADQVEIVRKEFFNK